MRIAFLHRSLSGGGTEADLRRMATGLVERGHAVHVFTADHAAPPAGVVAHRVPVLRAHSEALTIECERPITPGDVRDILKKAPGVKLVDDPEKNYFPMPKDATGQGDVLVGRIRQDSSDPSGKSIALFVAGDQLLKGAALNAVQIAEVMIEKGYL